LLGKPLGARRQLGVADHPLALLGRQLGEHDRHPALLLRLGHTGRDEHDGAISLAVRGHRPAAARAPAYLDRARPRAARGQAGRAALWRSGAVQWVGGHAPTLPAQHRGSPAPGTDPCRSATRALDLYDQSTRLWTT